MEFKKIIIKGARENNLKNIDVEIPKDKLVVLTGLSGSGKSSLLNEIVYPELSNKLNNSRIETGDFDSIENIDKLED